MPYADPPAAATVVITTKNRRDELRSAIRSAIEQTAPVEVLVIDDGSTDGTEKMVREEFPRVRFERSEQSRGLIVQRNRGARLASAPFLFSIDDDAVFSSADTVAHTLREFDDPRVGAVAIPFINVKQDQTVRQRAPEPGPVFVTDAYIGTAHALRRDLFVELGGYAESLFHQGEERDFCIRMLDAGFVTRLGTAEPIHHFESPRRDYRRMDHYGRRNDILFGWARVPFPECGLHLAATTIKGVSFGVRVARPFRMTWGLLCGYFACLVGGPARQPVRRNTYVLYRLLRKKGPVRLEQLIAGNYQSGPPAE
jgi:glycosyltransferase involved in cell wall biosynthesis